MLFDVTIPTTLDLRVLPAEEGAQYLMLAVMAGLGTPLQGGDGPLVLPAGIIRIPFGYDGGNALVDQLGEELPKVKPPSNIQVASSLAGIDRAVQMDKNLRGQ